MRSGKETGLTLLQRFQGFKGPVKASPGCRLAASVWKEPAVPEGRLGYCHCEPVVLCWLSHAAHTHIHTYMHTHTCRFSGLLALESGLMVLLTPQPGCRQGRGRASGHRAGTEQGAPGH